MPCASHTAVQRTQVRRLLSGRLSEAEDDVVTETPIELVYNGVSHAVMMATPSDLADFATGFSVSEGVIERPEELEIVDKLSMEVGISLQMLIPKVRWMALRDRARNLPARSGCGLCGTSNLEMAIRPVRRVDSQAAASVQEIMTAFEHMPEHQILNNRTGAVHAAAVLLENHGMIVREDVGRHNAVDKVLGAALRSGLRPRALLVTSRASYEIVHKAAQVQCAVVAAISAPTSLAVKLAKEANVTLLCYARPPRASIYATRAD